MASYNLTGIGTQGLTAGTTRLFVSVTSFPGREKFGRANPTNYYDLGLLRAGVQGSFGATRDIDAALMFWDLPANTDTLGYSLFPGTNVTVSEGAPIGGTHQFGTTTIGGTGNDNVFTTFAFVKATSLPASNGTLSAIVGYLYAQGAAGLEVALYADSSNHPAGLISSTTTPVTPGATQSWFSVPLSASIVSGTQYWFGLRCTNAGVSVDIWVAYTSTTSGTELYTMPGSGSWPSSAAGATAAPGFRYSIYGTYS
ncbi:MAG: hypothetical protein HRJ53_07645 [Acidobacteria bacterium Pan2503]|uniref:Uncharacterized protein n=1 Tax=Candidatus Acidiferrum panamense TaxID=2741543 RepID=A0A7V8NPC6_9BACT|nr:hypothetical protein [Candidatus Acidoferrum panamensis]